MLVIPLHNTEILLIYDILFIFFINDNAPVDCLLKYLFFFPVNNIYIIVPGMLYFFFTSNITSV